MTLQSLAYGTDLWFPRFGGQIIDRGDYLVVMTPENPGYMWGNFLLFRGAPEAHDLELWRRRFRAEIGEPLGVKHETFGWDSRSGSSAVIEPFLHAGFSFDCGSVLAAGELISGPRMAADVEVRCLASDEDWEQAIANQIVCRSGDFSRTEYETFKRRQFQLYHRMTQSGLGWWFGAFAGSRLVGDLGLFHNRRLARFQNVGTHPEYRCRGIAARLLHDAAQYARAHADVERLVIVADADSPTERRYMSLGFKRVERQCGLEKLP